MQPDSLDPVAGERLSHADKLFTSDLSINEFALLHGAGFEPIELVMGYPSTTSATSSPVSSSSPNCRS